VGAENTRLEDTKKGKLAWKRWGPYLSERQWGTVREDYSADGNAWDYFPYGQAMARAYRWGEDGLAGISDDRQLLCFAVALWNGVDATLKERLYGLSNSQGNHGEDVKEYYYYLDNTPTHSYMKYLYKYPQSAFPYEDLTQANAAHGFDDHEYELLDTGVFDEDRYYDVTVEYAKSNPDDILIRISATNRGPDPATLRILPTLWYRNVWSWYDNAVKPNLSADGTRGVRTSNTEAGTFILYCDGSPTLLFTENETNYAALFGGQNASAYTKDGINDYVVHGNVAAVNSDGTGTKIAADYPVTLASGETHVIRLRLTSEERTDPFADFDAVYHARQDEADAFFSSLVQDSLSDDERNVMRQALSGLLWTKQY
jgi:hypothetical protein